MHNCVELLIFLVFKLDSSNGATFNALLTSDNVFFFPFVLLASLDCSG